MKQQLTDLTKLLSKHKRMLWLLISMAVFAVGVMVYIGMTIAPSELRIITHYTAYGSTHFYRDQWVYLVSFMLFVLLAVVLGSGVSIKLLRQDREPLALLYGWVSVMLIAMTLVTYIHLTRFI